MIEIKKYTFSDKNIWDALVSDSKNGIFLFYRNYLDYHKNNFKDHSLIIYKKNKAIALFPANENAAEIFSHQGLTFGSLILSLNCRAVEVIAILSLIKKYYSNLGFTKIYYKTIPSIFHKYPAEEDLYALFRSDAKLVRRDISSVIKIKSKINFSESKKQAVTKCENLDVQVLENKKFDQYWTLLTEVLAKFKINPVHSLAEITGLKSDFPDNIRLFEARQNDILMAGVVVYDFDTVVHTQYMANSDEGRKLGVLDFINYKLINEIFKDREYFSFGISSENEGKTLNEGLIQQKEMMGSRGIVLDHYEIVLKN